MKMKHRPPRFRMPRVKALSWSATSSTQSFAIHFETQRESVWRTYRQRGGKRTRILADFLISAHAQKQATRLLSRDRGFYRNLFPSLDSHDRGEGTQETESHVAVQVPKCGKRKLKMFKKFGSSGRIRTYNPSVNSRMLYR